MYGKKFKVICCSILMIGTILTFTGCSDSAFNSSQLSESSQLSQPDESVVSSELTNSSSEPVTDSDTVIENTEDAQKLAFGKILWDAYLYGILPDGKTLEQTNNQFGIQGEENSFAICDVDNDGQDELLLYWTDASMAGTVGYIFGYRDHMVYNELSGYPSMRFYDNGTVEIKWSHNQGLGINFDFWPYNVYSYDAEKDSYSEFAKVDAWNKNVSNTKNGVPFPDNIDVDGNGIVYYILAPDSWDYGNAKILDDSEYQNWRQSYLGNSKPVNVTFKTLTADNIVSSVYPEFTYLRSPEGN